MATLDKSFVIIRFGFGKENVKGRQRIDNTYRYVVNKIAIRYAEGEYEKMKGRLKEGVEADVQRELVNLASLYRRHIVGANGATSRPAGVIRSVVGSAKPLALASALPAWAPRNAEYLKRKINAGAGNNWFDNRGWTRRKGQKWAPSETGVLFKESRAETWTSMFGPISVTFSRDNKAQRADQFLSPDGGKHLQVQIGTLRVYALGKLTPQMLPALNTKSGDIPVASDQGNEGLMDLVKAVDPRMAYRLGQRSSLTKRYRPTLEPFLSYFLTRSIPAAITRRLQQGSFKRITRSA